MYAVVRSDGRQHRVTLGETLQLDVRSIEVGKEIALEEVLLIRSGGETHIGSPLLAEASVHAKVLRHGRGPKIKIFTFKRRKGSSRRMGFRRDFTEVKIERISMGGVDLQAEAAAVAAGPEKAASKRSEKKAARAAEASK